MSARAVKYYETENYIAYHIKFSDSYGFYDIRVHKKTQYTYIFCMTYWDKHETERHKIQKTKRFIDLYNACKDRDDLSIELAEKIKNSIALQEIKR